jgi:hypothetical protein
MIGPVLHGAFGHWANPPRPFARQDKPETGNPANAAEKDGRKAARDPGIHPKKQSIPRTSAQQAAQLKRSGFDE